jgi:uncharacterized protein involved in response to NO
MSGVTEGTDGRKRKPVPRGIASGGPALLSYGFRPFFLGAGLFAVVAMAAWMGALVVGWDIGGSYGALNWHAHEMLFGYTSAALAGYMLTAIPNWTGRLPVSGSQLLGLFMLWLAGRIVMIWPGPLGVTGAALVDGVFLPTLAIVASTEVFAGRNWKNLKILAGLLGLSLANIAFHSTVILSGSAAEASRAGVAIYVVLISVVGGRVVPSFTRNWLAKAASSVLPVPFGRFDVVATGGLIAALLLWVAAPQGVPTAMVAAGAALLHAFRLVRWRGWLTIDEPLLLALHAGYAFVPIGLAAIAAAALGWIADASALHLLTVGAIGGMTLAIMTRAGLGHTGRPLKASLLTALSYLALVLCAVVRPFAELLPAEYHTLLGVAGTAWLAAFGLFVLEYAPILLSPRR